MYNAPIPLGPPILWAETVTKSAPSARAEKAPRPWTASVWRRAFEFLAARPRAMSATGCTVPSSLFTSMTETAAVSGRTASSTRAAERLPSGSGERYVTSYPSRSSHLQHSRTALCSTAVVTMCFPTCRFCHAAARRAQLSPSVPQEVKYSPSAGQSSRAATARRQSSVRFFIDPPKGYWELGFPYCSVRTSYMASATARGMGAVAAWSR